MPIRSDEANDREAEHGPSGQEVEDLCLLHAVGPDGCPVGELPSRLGLSPGLAGPVGRAIQPLIDGGLVAKRDEHVRLTDSGVGRLKSRLAELGVVHAWGTEPRAG